MKKLLLYSFFSVTILLVGHNVMAEDPCPRLMSGDSGTVGECRSYTIFDNEIKWCDTGAEGPGDCLVSD
ncbi:hypothetical protein LZF95_16805 [Algoriphagus sp. AGSA1]|uniref:hypothetical protein n=1 Tax=Algoriphagus sp. AGSA1 TaxID=2907213 RepID=UPI001F3D554B|nr:hypothetical protein [Algoriphagus sp. AGSA1]MCE7056345.1 hypothetical protein [Algoriphagus sp. AGSA1]